MGNLIRKNTDLTGINKALERIRGKHEGDLEFGDAVEETKVVVPIASAEDTMKMPPWYRRMWQVKK